MTLNYIEIVTDAHAVMDYKIRDNGMEYQEIAYWLLTYSFDTSFTNTETWD